MALKIRLRQQGRNNRRTYRLVVIESKQRRDGAYVECLGWYDPHREKQEDGLCLKADRIRHWLEHGAELSEKGAALVQRAEPALVQSLRQKEAERKARQVAKKREKKAMAASN